ncbi:MAG: hypothetical protein U0Z44_03350 [Kouleothrix sp.]
MILDHVLAARSGVWDQGGLIDDIRARRFSAIMLPVNVANHRSDRLAC